MSISWIVSFTIYLPLTIMMIIVIVGVIVGIVVVRNLVIVKYDTESSGLF